MSMYKEELSNLFLFKNKQTFPCVYKFLLPYKRILELKYFSMFILRWLKNNLTCYSGYEEQKKKVSISRWLRNST
jgi:hypothetical protein